MNIHQDLIESAIKLAGQNAEQKLPWLTPEPWRVYLSIGTADQQPAGSVLIAEVQPDGTVRDDSESVTAFWKNDLLQQPAICPTCRRGLPCAENDAIKK